MKNKIDPAKARAQWNGLAQTLRDLKGVNVVTLSSKAGCPDMVFTAENAR